MKMDDEVLRRQMIALEQIRDHYYPPPKVWWKRALYFVGKVICVIVAYLGIVEGIGFVLDKHEAQNLAEQYALVARQLYLEDGDARGAIDCYEKSIELSEGGTEYRIALMFQKGMAIEQSLFLQERPPTAEEYRCMDQILMEACTLVRLEPKRAMPHILMAQALLGRGEREDAVACAERALALEPENAPVRASACAIWFMAGRPEQARAQLDEAERLDPALPTVSCWKGLLALLADHDAVAARMHFKTMTQRVPRLSLGHALLGHAYLAGDKPELKLARAAFNHAIVLDARQVIALVGMADTYEREGNLVLARLWLDRALNMDETSVRARVAHARIDSREGDFPLAIRHLTKAIELAPFRADLYRQRAEVFDKAGDAASASSDRKTLKALMSGDASTSAFRIQL